MYRLTWDIRIGKGRDEYRLRTVKSVNITSSVLNLSDTAKIEMPGKYLNTWQKIEDKIKVGYPVSISLGYDDNNETEFNGYLKRISRENNSLVLECEDTLYLLDKTVADKEYKTMEIKSILTDLLRQVDSSLLLECDYDYKVEKMVVFHQTALDVLKKVQEETSANIWFENNTLHVHPVYQERSGETAVIFDTRVNVQNNELKWVNSADKKVEIEVVLNKPDGTQQKEKYGNSGGVKMTKYVDGVDSSDMKTAAESEFNLWNYSGFEGNFTGWLIPRVQAGGSVRLRDDGKPEGKYYVTGVEVEFGQSGAKRKITLGNKLV